MAGTTVRIKEESRAVLEELAREMNEQMQEVLAKALDAYRRQRIIELTNAAYAAMRENPELWQSELEERRAWEATLADGLDEGLSPTEA